MEVHAEEIMTAPHKKVRLTKYNGQMKVQFTRGEPGANMIQAEWGQRSKLRKWCGDSGSKGCVLGTITKQ